ncbi:MAG: hypothetical protein EHM35_20730, partial [Planctomycetaceae bacterium]
MMLVAGATGDPCMAIPNASDHAIPKDANTFQLLVGADAFVREYTASLKNCRKSLYVQFSTFEGDDSGQRVAHLMMEAASLGVEVRLIVDCYSDVVVNDTYPISLHRLGELRAERAATY